MKKVTNIFGTASEMHTVSIEVFIQQINLAIEDCGGSDEFSLCVFIEPQKNGPEDFDGYYCYIILPDRGGPIFLADRYESIALFQGIDAVLKDLRLGGVNMDGITIQAKY